MDVLRQNWLQIPEWILFRHLRSVFFFPADIVLNIPQYTGEALVCNWDIIPPATLAFPLVRWQHETSPRLTASSRLDATGAAYLPAQITFVRDLPLLLPAQFQ